MSLTAPRRVDNQPIRPLVPRRSLRSGGVVRSLYVATLLLGDVVAIALALVAAYHIHAAMEERPSRVAPLEAYTPTLLFLIASLLVTFALYHHYLPRRGGSRVDQLGQLLLAVTVGNIVALALSALTRRGLDIPQQVLGYGWALAIVFVWTTRTMIELGLRAARRAGLDPERVLIIGAGNEGNTISHKIASAPDLGFDLVGFVDDEEYGPVSRPWEDSRRGAPVLGGISELSQLLRRYRISRVIVADLSLSHAQILDDVVAVCDQARVDVLVVPDVFHLVVQEVSASEFGGMPMLRVRDVSMRGWNLRVKRALDVALATVLLIALSPFLIAVAVLVKVTSRGPVFFVQERVGMDGREFLCIKFRSMRLDAEAQTGPIWATPDDDRTTPLGRFLRRYSIDEFPQLVNVLLGDMSLVGPRPERPYFVREFSRRIPRYDRRHQEKAGMTGWAQVNGLRGQAPIEERTLYDLFYVERWSPAFDLKVLLKTIGAVLRGRDAY